MNIVDVYTKYKIMPSLQQHMLRVAGVASMLVQNLKLKIKNFKFENEVVAASLLHDMGNIIKFKLDLFPEFLEPEGLDYWQDVQKNYYRQYGRDEHAATLEIAEEVLRSSKIQDTRYKKRIMDFIDSFSFKKAKENYQSDDFGKMICSYSDMRVEPHGVVSLSARLEDGRKRFSLNKPWQSDDQVFEEGASYLREIENRIFQNCSISPEDITDKRVQDEIEKLKKFAF